MIIEDEELKCANCQNYVDVQNDMGYCLDCADAYNAGYERAMLDVREGRL